MPGSYNVSDPRELAIKSFYKTILGRDADKVGLQVYMDSDNTLDMIYMILHTSAEAEARRAKIRKEKNFISDTLPITLAMFVKDAEESVGLAIKSVKDVVREIIVVDTGSTDNTIKICEHLGARVYRVGFTDFGSIRTVTGHLARQPWVLGLDADEVILKEDWPVLGSLVQREDIDIWGLPRKRWADVEMTTQVEKEAYPDWQYRLFRNSVGITYTRRVHEIIEGSTRRAEAQSGPTIHHLQDVFKKGLKLKNRNDHYKKLYNLDLSDGIKHTCSAVQEIDERQ